MDIETLVNLALNSTVSILVIVFFMYRDIKFMSQLQLTLQALVDAVNSLRDLTSEKEEL